MMYLFFYEQFVYNYFGGYYEDKSWNIKSPCSFKYGRL